MDGFVKRKQGKFTTKSTKTKETNKMENNHQLNPLENLNHNQLHIIWEALSQFSENQLCDSETGDEIENPILDDLINKLDNYIANA